MLTSAARATSPADEVLPAGAPAGGRRALVLIGGLPGAGKTRLLARLLAAAPPGTRGLDSEQVAAALATAGLRLPYRLLRPVVHAVHRVRVRAVLRGGSPAVVLTDPLTSPRRRASLLRSARRAAREVRLVLVDAAPEEARRGQADRRRTISARSMARHVRRWRAAREELRAPGGAVGVAAVVVVDRTAAARLTLDALLRD